MIKRHATIDIFMHWFNAVCWLFLLGTGLGLLENDTLQLFGGHWTRWMRRLFGSGEALLAAHEIVGVLWAGGFFIYGLLRFRKAVWPFTREILTFSIPRDFTWLFKKGILMTLGPKILDRNGVAPDLPEQGFYNAGQKLFAVPALFGGILLAVSGILMAASKAVITETGWVQWAILVHFLCAALVSTGLLVHIYMAALAAGERPALLSMFTGKIDEHYARHHHRLWYEQVMAKRK